MVVVGVWSRVERCRGMGVGWRGREGHVDGMEE